MVAINKEYKMLSRVISINPSGEDARGDLILHSQTSKPNIGKALKKNLIVNFME